MKKAGLRGVCDTQKMNTKIQRKKFWSDNKKGRDHLQQVV